MVPQAERSYYVQGNLSDHGQPQGVHQTNLKQENNLLNYHLTCSALSRISFGAGQFADSMVPQAERSYYVQGNLFDHGQPQGVHQTNLM